MNVETINGRRYHLPGRQSAFQKALYVHLIDWKWKHITEELGFNKHMGNRIPYDAILPDALQEEMPHLYPSVVRQLADHRQRNHIRIHPHFYHMASSQAANINLFLPILHHSRANAILKEINHDFVSLATDQLDNGYCLEFWGGNFGEDQHFPTAEWMAPNTLTPMGYYPITKMCARVIIGKSLRGTPISSPITESISNAHFRVG